MRRLCGRGDVLPRGMGGGGYDTVEFHVLHRNPLECDSSGRRDMIHRCSVPYPHPPPCLVGEGGFTGQNPLYIFARFLHPLPLFLLQRRPNCLSQPLYPCMAPPGFLPREDSLVDESPCLLQDPLVVAHGLFFWLRHSAPQLVEDLIQPCPLLTSGKSGWESHPSPKVA